MRIIFPCFNGKQEHFPNPSCVVQKLLKLESVKPFGRVCGDFGVLCEMKSFLLLLLLVMMILGPGKTCL